MMKPLNERDYIKICNVVAVMGAGTKFAYGNKVYALNKNGNFVISDANTPDKEFVYLLDVSEFFEWILSIPDGEIVVAVANIIKDL